MQTMAMSPSRAMQFRNAAAMQIRAAHQAASEETIGTAMARTAVVNGSLAVFSMMNGYFGNPKAGGVVAYDGLAALFFHGGALASRYIPVVRDLVPSSVRSGAHMIGDGAFGSFLSKLFTGIGVDLKTKTSAAPAPAAAGYGGRYGTMAGVGALSADEAALYVR